MDWVAVCEWFSLIALIVLVLVVILGLIRYSRLPEGARFLLAYLGAILVIEVIAKLIGFYGSGNNHFLMYVYALLEFVLLSLMYRSLFDQPHLKQWLTSYTIVGSLIIVTYSVYEWLNGHHNSQQDFNLYSKIFVSGSIIIYASTYLFCSLKDASWANRETRILNRINAGVLVYFSGSFIIFMTLNYLVNIPLSESVFFWLINILLVIAFYTLCFMSILNLNRKWK